MRTNESGTEFLQRFRETRNLCFSLNLTDDQLAALAVQGMLPAWRKKLLGQEFDNLGQLAQWVAVLNSQLQNMRRDTWFQKSTTMVEAYNPYSVDDDYEDYEEEEVAVAEWNWGKKTVMVLNPWGRGVEESYDFDVTKSDKLFDFVLEKGQIKLPDNHVMLPPDQLKNKKFCKFHNATSHSTNECRVFWQHIQRAIQQGRLKFDTPRKMKVDDNPFPRDQNMVDARCSKERLKS